MLRVIAVAELEVVWVCCALGVHWLTHSLIKLVTDHSSLFLSSLLTITGRGHVYVIGSAPHGLLSVNVSPLAGMDIVICAYYLYNTGFVSIFGKPLLPLFLEILFFNFFAFFSSPTMQ